MNIWLISDTHFWHENIIRYENRPFKSVNEMNKIMAIGWAFCVYSTDIIFHLGDVSLGLAQPTLDLCNMLPGQKVLIRGNHDRQRTHTFWKRAGFLYVTDEPIDLGFCILSHEPLKYVPDGVTNYHGHVHSQIPKVSDRHVNVSVDVTNFKPVKLTT